MYKFKNYGKDDDPVDDWSESPLDKLPKPQSPKEK